MSACMMPYITCERCSEEWLFGFYNPTLCCPKCGWDPLNRQHSEPPTEPSPTVESIKESLQTKLI